VGSLWAEAPRGRMHAYTAQVPVSGHAPDVVLVHGLGVAGEYMLPLLRRLAPHCRVHAVDLPGFGRSYKPMGALSLPELADALALWLNLLGLAKAHLIANSFGCQILAEFAIRHPERIGKLVMQGPTLHPGFRGRVRPFLPFALNGLLEPVPLGLVVLREYLHSRPRIILETFRICVADAVERKLPRVSAPTLVVRGSKDPIVPQSWAETVAELLPRGELRVIPGMPHTINFTGPLELARVVKPFLNLNSNGGAP
jgi:2-hydroxy-6-oxonona-2,4-dienedioate hydrolase